MKRILLIVLLILISSNAYAEPQVCFKKVDAIDIIMKLDNYEICKDKVIAYSNIKIQLEGKIDTLTKYNVLLESQIKNSDEVIKDKDELLEKQEELCEIRVIAATPTLGDKSMWAGMGALFITILFFAL